MNRSSFTVRGSDCDAGAPMKKMPINVSKPAVAIFRSIVAIRQLTSCRRPPHSIAPTDQNQNDTNHDRGNTWRGIGKPRYGAVLLLWLTGRPFRTAREHAARR